MNDRFGRKIEYMRVSVTHNCNLKCIYCSPGESSRSQKCPGILSPEEFEKIVTSAAKAGISKIRITGGEPLTRTDICEIIGRISKIHGIQDISMTTNGVNLDKMAIKLKAVGLMRLNISLDSLKKDRFKYITGGGRLEDTLDGLKKALELGLNPVKTNTVVIKGVNDDEIDDFIELAKDNPLEVRFIELMPIGRFGEQNADKIVYNSDIIRARPELVFCEEDGNSNVATYYRINDYQGKIGFISPMSHRFCSCCNRIRLTCDGKIRPCLGNNGEVDILEVLSKNPGRLDEAVEKAIYEKPEGHHFGDNFLSSRNMSMIGG